MIYGLLVQAGPVLDARVYDVAEGRTHVPLEALQSAVGGVIEAVTCVYYPPEDLQGEAYTAATVFFHEEGKLLGLPPNPWATHLAIQLGWQPYGDVLVGPCLFLGPPGAAGEETPITADVWDALRFLYTMSTAAEVSS